MLFDKNIHQQLCNNKHYHFDNQNGNGEFWVLQNHHHCEALHSFECPTRLVIVVLLQLLNAHIQPQNN
jgi:hypothetical protein